MPILIHHTVEELMQYEDYSLHSRLYFHFLNRHDAENLVQAEIDQDIENIFQCDCTEALKNLITS